MAIAIRRSLGNVKYWIRYYWKPIIIALIAAVVLLSGTVFAATWHEGYYEDDPGGLLGIAYDWIDDIMGPKYKEEAAQLLQVGYETDGNGAISTVYIGPYTSSGFGGIIRTINSYCVGIALIGVCVVFLVDFSTMRENEVTGEEVFRRMFLFVFSFIIVCWSLTISMAVMNMGTSITNSLTASLSANGASQASLDAVKAEMWKATHNKDVLKAQGEHVGALQTIACAVEDASNKLGYVVELLLPHLLFYLATVIINVICWSRAIEMIIMASFSPLAFMDGAALKDMTHSSGWRYIKTMLAISIQGAIIIAILQIGGGFMGTIAAASSTGDLIEKLGQLILITIAQAGLAMRSNSIAKSVLAIG